MLQKVSGLWNEAPRAVEELRALGVWKCSFYRALCACLSIRMGRSVVFYWLCSKG